jgi:hypothetical protein
VTRKIAKSIAVTIQTKVIAHQALSAAQDSASAGLFPRQKLFEKVLPIERRGIGAI